MTILQIVLLEFKPETPAEVIKQVRQTELN